jgi:hypothetical protein
MKPVFTPSVVTGHWGRRGAFLLLVLLLVAQTSSAWVYPEHRDIALLAIQNLDPERRAVLDELWAAARIGHEARLTEAVADFTQGEKPDRLDYAAWPAIAGDHSCSGRDMVHNVLETKWILGVADICARLKNELAKANSRNAHINALRDSDIDLQRTDPEYATRAGSNNVHFLLARPAFDITPEEYGDACLSEGVELNGMAAYSWYHVSALEKMARLSQETLSPEKRSALALAALADEAFAVHFLQDAFASGHVAGTWGDASLRKGTHDHYNEAGLEVATWVGERMILMGDAWMRPQDAERAAETIRESLEQLLDVARGVGPAARLATLKPPSDLANDFNVCKTDTVPPRVTDDALVPLLTDVLEDTPIPALESGLGQMPRFRAELGPFVGVSSAIRAEALSGGFGNNQDNPGATGGLEINVRVGLGLDGVMNESGDGLVFLELGTRLDAPSTMSIGDFPSFIDAGAITAAVPGRSAFNMRVRMPFWLLPFDLLIAGPILLVASPTTLTNMAVVAGNGGLIPWQAGIASVIGRFQFILGREVGASFYGYGDTDDRMLIPTEEVTQSNYTLIGLRSIKFDFPVLEYRPFRTFSLDQSTNLVLQFFAGLDVPTRVTVVAPPDAPEPNLKPIWEFGLRIAFDWRYYW